MYLWIINENQFWIHSKNVIAEILEAKKTNKHFKMNLFVIYIFYYSIAHTKWKTIHEWSMNYILLVTTTNFLLFIIQSFTLLLSSWNRLLKYLTIKLNRSQTIIVTWDWVCDQIGITVAIYNAYSRDKHFICVKNCSVCRHYGIQSIEKDDEIRKSSDPSKFILKVKVKLIHSLYFLKTQVTWHE